MLTHPEIANTYYYIAISEFYKGKQAKRSKLPYMNHIDEGITILKHLRAPAFAVEAYCLHPLFQSDKDLKDHCNSQKLHSLMGSRIMQYVMEYRNVANNFLSPDNAWKERKKPKLSPINIVNWMLLADKIQNYKDFKQHQVRCPSPNANRDSYTLSGSAYDSLDEYFTRWLDLLVPNFGFSNREIEYVTQLISIPQKEAA